MLLHQRLFVPVGRQVKLKLNRLRGRVHRAYVTEHLAVIADGGGAGASSGDDLRARHLGTGGRQADRCRRDRGAVIVVPLSCAQLNVCTTGAVSPSLLPPQPNRPAISAAEKIGGNVGCFVSCWLP